jgi:uncharacterized protein (TIGR00730 family)
MHTSAASVGQHFVPSTAVGSQPPVATVCVFAGSARRSPSAHEAAAHQLGTAIANAGITLVFGGASTGMMGAVADAALAAGGSVIGVVPRGLFGPDEVHDGVELIEVETLHERKQLMLDLAEAFVGLPGGFGTLDEVSEVLTWAQLGMHAKPIVLLDLDGSWRGLIEWIDDAIVHGYVIDTSREFFVVAHDAGDVLSAIAEYQPPPAPRALSPEQT